MHDPAWWWVKASNLGTLSGVAVRFSLAHGIVAAGGGDMFVATCIRSALHRDWSVDKVIEVLSDRVDDDFADYAETQNEVIQSIQQADGSACMAGFATTSPSTTPPRQYFDDAKI